MFLAALVVAIDLLGFGIVLPLMPRLADEYLASYSNMAKGVVIGVLYSSFSLMQFVFAPMWGRLSDRHGRRPILLLGLVGSVVFYGLFAFASSMAANLGTVALVLMLVSRCGAGIAGATVGTAAAVIADCTTPDKRARGMALIGAGFGIGFTFGPLIAYLGLNLFQQQKWGVGAIASLISLGALLLAYFKLPETRTASVSKDTRSAFSVSRTLDILRLPTVGPVIFAYFLAIFGFANFEATLALVTKSLFGFADDENFLVFAGIGSVLFVAQMVYRALVGRWKEPRMLVVGTIMMLMGMAGIIAVAVGAFLLPPGGNALGMQPMFYLSIAIAVIGFGFVNSSSSALVSKRADRERQGEIQGVNQSCASLGRILGPFVGSVVFQWHSSRVLPYLVAVATLVLVLLVLPAALRTPPQSPSASPES
jgi:MFS transporter, DHA1 family, tetracycline resistance protein